ncbi:hypothetical protein CKO51_04540 [Rhodopirellula sp. SM50]|nr:efflux RND transporter periplasmic adaptor subunit [Rhodopirellula sp. SM50]PAY20762.1 hypothetical protein CKO51_04540 [Rhodopirellula sp. SM50]
MSTEIPNAGSSPAAPILVGAVTHETIQAETPRSRVHATPRNVIDPTVDPPVVSPFQSATTLQHADQILLERLDELSTILAVVRCDPNAHDESQRLHHLRIDPAEPRPTSQRTQLISVCHQAALSGQVHSRRQLEPERVILGVPIVTGRQPSDALGLIATLPADLHGFTQTVQTLAQQFALWNLQHRLDQQFAVASHAAATVELLTRALDSKTRNEACQVIVTELADHWNLCRAAIGIAASGAGGCRLVALSDSTRIDTTTAQTRSIENAMDEALMRGSISIVEPTTTELDASRSVGELARQHAASVLAVPLVDEARDTRAVFLAILDSESPIQPMRQFFEAAGPSLGAVLHAHDQRRSTDLLRRSSRAVRSRGGAIALTVMIALIAAMFVPLPHRETCDVRVEPRFKRFVAAPFDATLKDCFVAPGDLVRRGDLLATLDGRELRWKRDALQADHDQAIKKRDAAQASRAYADQRIAQLEIDGLRSELQLLDLRLSELELRSPVTGMVVAGDLKRVKGAPLTTGQSLFEIAPLQEMIVEAAVKDDQIAYVRKDHSAQLRLNAYPDRNWDTTIGIVNPRSEIRDEENVFIAECKLSNDEQLLRPGMKGTLKIACGRRALGWILFHRPIEALAQWFWW